MTIKFQVTKTGSYSKQQLDHILPALEFAGILVQNVYQFKQDINVKVRFEDMSREGGGATMLGNGGPLLIEHIKDAYYPISLGKVGNNTPQEGYDIELSYCCKVNWYIGVDGKPSPVQYDLVTVTVHELHHGLGWVTASMRKEVSEDGTRERIVRDRMFPVLCFEKFICFETKSGKLCPIAPYFHENDADMEEGEKIRLDEMLLRILQSNRVYFCAGDTKIKLYAPNKFKDGCSIEHLDIREEPKSVMQPFHHGVQHEIGATTRQIVNIMRDFDQAPLDECDCKLEEPKEAPDQEPIYAHDQNKTGSVTDINALKPTKTIKKTKGQSKGTKTKGQSKGTKTKEKSTSVNTKWQSRAINIVQKTFKEILRLDVHFKTRLQMVDFDSEEMQNFTDDEKKSGIVVHHRQNVEVDGVVLPIAVARQIEDPKTIRRRAEHPKYTYDIEIFVDINAEWDYTSTAVSGDGFMGFQSTLLSMLCEAFRFTNCLEYVERTEDKKGKPTFQPKDRKLFLDDDFAKVWMRPTRARRADSPLSPVRPGTLIGRARFRTKGSK